MCEQEMLALHIVLHIPVSISGVSFNCKTLAGSPLFALASEDVRYFSHLLISFIPASWWIPHPIEAPGTSRQQ